ncbi:DUF3859 domain-containing protein [Thalassotalea agarivorans]|uniref:DUF3859 domain-containing protein n=1 Tax=Thalassotalea agarivorans TaxID=349064 RepID=A0A1I0HJ15_THASX|nr:DUF3859 domain-containing protein [Thalassotalea agarivorans]SET83819.1 protein of unknown function [Thalassotalea agarivorans]
MAKQKPVFTLKTCGIHSSWDETSKNLPKIKAFTHEVPAKIDIEFGYILNVQKGKGIKLDYCIYHPDIPDDNGRVMAPFDGEVYVRNSDWDFYLGDTIWAPIENKIGPWRIVIKWQDRIVADELFNVIKDEDSEQNYYQQLSPTFGKRRKTARK